MLVAKADGNGLTFTLSEDWAAASVLLYRHGGTTRELTSEQYPDSWLKLVRERTCDARAEIQTGVDVAHERQREKDRISGRHELQAICRRLCGERVPELAAGAMKQWPQHVEGVICAPREHVLQYDRRDDVAMWVMQLDEPRSTDTLRGWQSVPVLAPPPRCRRDESRGRASPRRATPAGAARRSPRE